MDIESDVIQVELPEASESAETQKTEKRSKSAKKKEPKTKEPQKKKLIAQIPEDAPEEYAQFLETRLKDLAVELELESSEVRKLRPEVGGKPKKYATTEDEKEHYKQYFKDYYKEKLAKSGTCQHCNKEFKTFTSVSRHIQRSKQCQALRAQKADLLKGLAPPQHSSDAIADVEALSAHV